jgi:hypothetical protein
MSGWGQRYEDTLQAQERFEGVRARYESVPADEGDDGRPGSEELAELAESAQWPTCRQCRRIARPGVDCSNPRCPFTRVEGLIGDPHGY